MSSGGGAATEEFIVTKEYRRCTEFGDACRRDRYIGRCYGPPGVGKTLSARQYARWALLEAARPHYRWPAQPPAAALPCRTVLDTAPVTGSAGKVERGVRDLRQRVSLLVEDAISRSTAAPGTATPRTPRIIPRRMIRYTSLQRHFRPPDATLPV